MNVGAPDQSIEIDQIIFDILKTYNIDRPFVDPDPKTEGQFLCGKKAQLVGMCSLALLIGGTV